jgi:sphinganine C4-monooxygenase
VTFHSRHHRLYVPYAFGALYNHPFEGFLLDTAGTGVAFLVSRMTIRQSMWFFTFSTIKTVDDHCGYAFPWDPLQLVTNNNSAYHDIHHQSWGIKTNFSQPFFTIWDRFMDTQWEGDVSLRYERTRAAAERQVQLDKQGLSADTTAAEPDPLAAGDPDQDRPESGPSLKAAKRELRSTASVRSRRTDSLKGLGHGVNGSIRQK